jgi:hypothetical protein
MKYWKCLALEVITLTLLMDLKNPGDPLFLVINIMTASASEPCDASIVWWAIKNSSHPQYLRPQGKVLGRYLVLRGSFKQAMRAVPWIYSTAPTTNYIMLRP